MKNRRSRWMLAALAAAALGGLLLEAPLLPQAAVATETPKSPVHASSAPPVHASWQVTLMTGRW